MTFTKSGNQLQLSVITCINSCARPVFEYVVFPVLMEKQNNQGKLLVSALKVRNDSYYCI
jgi:hypothetical protein